MRKIITLFLVFLSVHNVLGQVVFGRNQNNTTPGLSINYSSPKVYEIADIEVKGVQ